MNNIKAKWFLIGIAITISTMVIYCNGKLPTSSQDINSINSNIKILEGFSGQPGAGDRNSCGTEIIVPNLNHVIQALINVPGNGSLTGFQYYESIRYWTKGDTIHTPDFNNINWKIVYTEK